MKWLQVNAHLMGNIFLSFCNFSNIQVVSGRPLGQLHSSSLSTPHLQLSNKLWDWSHLVSLVSTYLRSRSTHQHRKQLSFIPTLYPVKTDLHPTLHTRQEVGFELSANIVSQCIPTTSQSVSGLLERRGCRFCILSVMMTSNDDT